MAGSVVRVDDEGEGCFGVFGYTDEVSLVMVFELGTREEIRLTWCAADSRSRALDSCGTAAVHLRVVV